MDNVTVPTGLLRFVERDGKRILQQCFVNRWMHSYSDEWREEILWEDVPMEVETKQGQPA